MTDYRDLPPVEPVEIPRRFSMTLIAKDDECPRSAYLYLKHEGGAQSHNMDRGTLAHEVFERAMRTLIATDEKRFAPDDPEQAASMMSAIVDEVLRERLDLVVPRRDVDDVREMAFHWAVAYDVDPEHVAGLEQLMVLDLECGITISGKIDVLAFPSPDLALIDDYKSSQSIVTQAEYEGSTQPILYAALVCFGVPVKREPCPACHGETPELLKRPGTLVACPCDGKGYVEHRGTPIGKHVKGVWMRQVYPHPKPRDDGLLHHREMLLSRTAIADFLADLETKAVRLRERFTTWRFPAVAGSWCSICPASAECPLPATLRDHAGEINSLEQAEEAWALAQKQRERTAAIEREVKLFAKAHDVPIRVGDEEWRWGPSESRALKRTGRGADWDGLTAAIDEAVNYGTPFDPTEWIRPTVSNGFRKSKVVES